MLKDDVGTIFRNSALCYLGTWHVMKMASTCVWRMAASDFIAPLFHQFFPNIPFPASPRLVLSTKIFSLIRLAYPSFREQLNNALQKEALSDIQKGHLVNLRSLCEWFIPKVEPFMFLPFNWILFIFPFFYSSTFPTPLLFTRL